MLFSAKMLFLAGLRQASRGWCRGILGLSLPALKEAQGAVGELAGLAQSHCSQPGAHGTRGETENKCTIFCLSFSILRAAEEGNNCCCCCLYLAPGSLRNSVALWYTRALEKHSALFRFHEHLRSLHLGNSLLLRAFLSAQSIWEHHCTKPL